MMVTKARYSRGVGTVFMIKFEGTCIWTGGLARLVKSESAKEAHEDISGEEDRQRGSVLGVIEVQVRLKAFETSVGQITTL